jgi:hypothetical protein
LLGACGNKKGIQQGVLERASGLRREPRSAESDRSTARAVGDQACRSHVGRRRVTEQGECQAKLRKIEPGSEPGVSFTQQADTFFFSKPCYDFGMFALAFSLCY